MVAIFLKTEEEQGYFYRREKLKVLRGCPRKWTVGQPRTVTSQGTRRLFCFFFWTLFSQQTPEALFLHGIPFSFQLREMLASS